MVNYETIESGCHPVKAWVKGVPVDENTREQLRKTALLPFIYKHVAAMPDCHLGIGATVGSVIPTQGAIIPAAVGVDLGCGMMAIQTNILAKQLPDNPHKIRQTIEQVVPLGFSHWGKQPFDKQKVEQYSQKAQQMYISLDSRLKHILEKHPQIRQRNVTPAQQMGSLGGGNHFIELCLDEFQQVWIMLHSGSRGIGNRIGSYFIALAKKDMERHLSNLPSKDLAYLSEGAEHFNDYIEAVHWAQEYARLNRDTMMVNIVESLQQSGYLPNFYLLDKAVNCHHNYVALEEHYGNTVYITRKGAIRAGVGDMGIIPGSMGARSFIVRGKGNPESFHSCSHGAGRVMSRTQAKKAFTIADHIAATEGVECRKDLDVIDETPQAYKNIDDVMAAQSDLVEVVHTLKQVVCIKG